MSVMSEEMSVLIVDDERSSLEILLRILRTDYDVYIAKSGRAAVELAREIVPDVILLDVVMPDMDGFAVLERIRDMPELRNTRVIFITGLRSEQDEASGLRMGAVDYITKPYHHAIVQARVRNQMLVVQQIRTIERVGMIDANTNIANRRSFDGRLELEWGRSIRENLPISLVMLDIDHFKRYNDSYGHMIGDELLRMVAKTISGCCNRGSDLPARYGGDEFVVLLPNTAAKGALRVAESIRFSVSTNMVNAGDENISVTVSVGVVTMQPVSECRFEILIEEADKLLYKAKDSGRNTVCAGEINPAPL